MRVLVKPVLPIEAILNCDPDAPLEMVPLAFSVVDHEKQRILSTGLLQFEQRWTIIQDGDSPEKSRVIVRDRSYPIWYSEGNVPHITCVGYKNVLQLYDPGNPQHRALPQLSFMLDSRSTRHGAQQSEAAARP